MLLFYVVLLFFLNHLNAELNPICHLLALLGAHHIFHINRIHSFISIQPLGRFQQEPEPRQATGMALAHYILGKFLGVGCRCFPPPLDVPTFSARERPLAAEGGILCGREMFRQISSRIRLPRNSRDLYMPQICDMGQTALLHLRRKAC